VAAGETCTAADAALGLRALNRKVDQWKAQKLALFTVTRSLWTVVSGQQDYTVGPTGDVDISRPQIIEHVNFLDTTTSPSQEYQLQPLTDDAWSRVPQKGLTSALPTSFYWNPTFPFATLSLWPIPTSGTLQGVLYASAPIDEFATLVTAVSLPPGYQEFIVCDLALQLATSYGRQIDPALAQRAIEAKRIVKASNERLSDLSFELGALVQGASGIGYWDIVQGP
jgi:hypothetical protein